MGPVGPGSLSVAESGNPSDVCRCSEFYPGTQSRPQYEGMVGLGAQRLTICRMTRHVQSILDLFAELGYNPRDPRRFGSGRDSSDGLEGDGAPGQRRGTSRAPAWDDAGV